MKCMSHQQLQSASFHLSSLGICIHSAAVAFQLISSQSTQDNCPRSVPPEADLTCLTGLPAAADGSYEICNDPYFSSNRLSLVDRGFIFAIAHTRGGGEMGRQWYEDGKYLHKKNTFVDFVACAEHLVQKKYTSASKLCMEVCY